MFNISSGSVAVATFCCGGIAVITRIQIAVDFRDRKYLSRGGNAESAGIALTVLYLENRPLDLIF